MTAVATGRGAGRIGDVNALTDGYSAAFLGAAAVSSWVRSSPGAAVRHPRRSAPAADLQEQPLRTAA